MECVLGMHLHIPYFDDLRFRDFNAKYDWVIKYIENQNKSQNSSQDLLSKMFAK